MVNQQGVEIKHLEERTHLYERLLEQVPKTVNSIMNEFDKDSKRRVNHLLVFFVKTSR